VHAGRHETLEGGRSESPGLPTVTGLVTCVGVKEFSVVQAWQQAVWNFGIIFY
jgi:hypothetical protein